MQNGKALNINIDELCSAMEDSSFENHYYLDLENGEILLLIDYSDDEEGEKLREKIDDEPERYELIPKLESHESYADLEDFVATLKDEHLVELLEVAINGKGAFRRFKDVLFRFPEERERWFQFKDARIRERVREWLEDIDITLSKE
jgi:hypothetical protein